MSRLRLGKWLLVRRPRPRRSRLRGRIVSQELTPVAARRMRCSVTATLRTSSRVRVLAPCWTFTPDTRVLMRLVYQPSDALQVRRWQLHFELVGESTLELAPDEFYLRFSRGALSLHRGGDDHSGIRMDGRETLRRLKGASALLKACGPPKGRTILDATAGLGTDLLLLHSKGFTVQGIERNAVLYALLDSYLQAEEINDVLLTLGDARDELASATAPVADVIYLDPMFPETGKTALPGKRMQHLRALLDEPTTAPDDLLALARARARDRVVLKRRRRDPVIGEPAWQVKGKSVRYDVYRTKSG